MQRPLEAFFNTGSSAGVVPGESRPVVIRIGKTKRPVGRPKKPAKSATRLRQLVDYSSTDTEKSTDTRKAANVTPPVKKCRIHRMYSQSQKRMVAYYARQHGIRKAARRYKIHHSNVERWVKNQVVSLKNPKKRSNKRGQG